MLLRLAPLVGVGGYANEPAFSIANQVLQQLLAPPLAWPWNRKTNAGTAMVAGTQDYTVVLTDFGWLEKATITLGSAINELEIAGVLPEESKQARPMRIAAQTDDGAGNIKFRLFPVPDQAYTLTLTYQAAAPLFTKLTQTWAPVPDRLQHLYTTGFLARAYELADDGRFPMTLQLFLSQVAAANSGLSETQKNLFLWEAMRNGRQMSRVTQG